VTMNYIIIIIVGVAAFFTVVLSVHILVTTLYIKVYEKTST
jgi:hypothetical protein